MQYRTPGVYVEEVSLFPPSVAAVETAIPAFIGYTETNSFRGEDLESKAVRISSLLEYEERFGYGPSINVNSVALDANNNVVDSDINSTFYLYYSLKLFFNNGGGDCYIISVGTYTDTPSANALQDGLEQVLYKTDEPTLIVYPDGVLLGKASLAGLYQVSLQQCQELKDRFLIMDVHMQDSSNNDVDFPVDIVPFRSQIGTRNLSYGAAYYPYLKTTIGRNVKYRDVMGLITKLGTPVNWNNFIDPANTELANLITAINQIVTDNTTQLEADIQVYLATQQGAFAPANIASLEDIYLILENALQVLIVDPTTSIADLRTALINIIQYIYEIADLFLDNYASDNAATPSPITNPELLTLIRSQCDAIATDPTTSSGINPTLDTLAKIDNAAVDNNIFGGSSSFPNYGTGTLSWEYSTVGAAAAFADIFAATNNTYTNIDAILPHPAPSNSSQRIENIGAIIPILRSVFYRTYSTINQIYEEASNIESQSEASLLLQIPVLKNVIDTLSNDQFIMPPAGAIAGLYANVDNARGVFKAPANVSLNSISEPVANISISDNDRLNVDNTAGKSINVIKSFVGKGTLVWGARTMAGNDNEWRYVSVRRFFIFAEESIKKATEQFVFEPNDQNTWIKVKAMIENFLTNQWREGALAGAKPNQAFFVKIGLGETMTAIDILEGRMIVEIGMAVVRPAEFIILRFSHKMQEA